MISFKIFTKTIKQCFAQCCLKTISIFLASLDRATVYRMHSDAQFASFVYEKCTYTVQLCIDSEPMMFKRVDSVCLICMD